MNNITALPVELAFVEWERAIGKANVLRAPEVARYRVDRRVRFVNRRRVNMEHQVLKFIPSAVGSKLRRTLQQTRAHLDVLEGRPSEVALPLSYWRSGVSKPASNLDPARDGCGLLWYAPLVPMKEEIVRDTVEMVRRVCLEHKIEPLKAAIDPEQIMAPGRYAL